MWECHCIVLCKAEVLSRNLGVTTNRYIDCSIDFLHTILSLSVVILSCNNIERLSRSQRRNKPPQRGHSEDPTDKADGHLACRLTDFGAV